VRIDVRTAIALLVALALIASMFWMKVTGNKQRFVGVTSDHDPQVVRLRRDNGHPAAAPEYCRER
jgi:hypothetical protein